ncbi:MAG: hypothetical protein FWD93_05035, partial [Coriobacteriia bacterium]|nr:hypothetical protein [Coriobacteriia bacterium]
MEVKAVNFNGTDMDYVYVNGVRVIEPDAQPTGEIWYLDFRRTLVSQEKPNRAPIGTSPQDYFEMLCHWWWDEIFRGRWQNRTLNIFAIPQRYVER